MRTSLALALALLFAPSLLAAQPKGISFNYKDWELACDNTGTCRAAGYSSGEVSVLLTRKAGPHSTVNVEAVFAQQSADQPLRLKATLLIDDASKGELTNQPNEYFSLSYEQKQAFITALRQDDKIEFESNGERKQLSTAGSNAVLLKMDEFQKRIGTDSALLHPGTGNSNTVLSASPAPEIITQPVIRHPEITRLTTAQLQKIAPRLQLTPEMGCQSSQDDVAPPYYRIPIDKRHVLIQTACFDISRFATWLTDNTLTARPELITHDAEEYRGEELVKFSGPIQSWVWDGKRFALRDEYRSGGQGSMSIGGVWTLPTFVSNVRTQRDVNIDSAALQALYDAVMQEKTKHLALDNLTAHFPITKSWTDFELFYAELGDPPPTAKPSEDISNDEWQAFLRSPVTADTESGHVSYSLVDLDGDGRRDLIINSYVGGTGLFNYTGVLKRGESTFYVANKDAYEDEFGVAGALFSENGRGANQWSRWIEINGQVYALWFNGRFGEDNLYLLRPFSTAAKTPAVTVRYRYEYDMDSIGPLEEGQPLKPELNNKDKAKLINALNKMQSVPLKGQQTGHRPSPICPIPPGTSPEDADRYSSGNAGSYMSEPIADIPIWVNGECFIGSVESYFGRGEFITVVSPKAQEIVGDYSVAGSRRVTSIKSGWKIREGDNGVQ